MGSEMCIRDSLRADQSVGRSFIIEGLILKGIKTPDLNSKDDGEAVVATLMFAYDDVIPGPI